ncbi:MAG TPA: septum formation initiator family protein [Candidatus Eisenbacteria bacterium]
MMRPPYQSPPKPPRREPGRRFLRLPPAEARRRHRGLWIAAGLAAGYLIWSFVGSDTGAFRIAGMRRENAALERRKIDLAVQVNDLEQRRKEQAHDPMLEERVARERFHLVKKDEILYRYDESRGDSLP